MSAPSPAETQPASHKSRAYRVLRSKVHGRGVFAQRDIAVSECVIEYTGREITWEEALVRAEALGGPHNHTFFFSLANGNVVDGGDGGNASRWINHSCEPNCEAIEDEGRIYIYALCDIRQGEELSYSYPLIYDGRHTPAIKRAFACHCGTPGCTGTMLAPKPRARKPRPKQQKELQPAPAQAQAPAEHLPAAAEVLHHQLDSRSGVDVIR